MLKGEDIICISSIDWDFIWQGHQEIMSTLADNGNRVLFIENTGVRSPGIKDIPRLKRRIDNYFKGVKGIRREKDNLYIFSPIVLPFPYSGIARRINKIFFLSALKRWMRVLDFADPIIWAFLPTAVTLDTIDGINKKLSLYYCIDNFSASSPAARRIRDSEKRLLKKADLVFVTSKALYDYCSQYNNRISIFPFGVNIDEFEKVRSSDSRMPDELKGIKGPIVGYVGGIHRWIDQELVKRIVLDLAEFNFVFIGPVQTDISLLSGIRNIHFLGNKNHRELPYFIKYFDIAIVPYLINDYTKNVYPTKLNEYLSMGKPVISTELLEVAAFNQKYGGLIYTAQEDDFSAFIKKALREDNVSAKEKRVKVARDNSWQSRIEEMSAIIENTMGLKMQNREAGWKDSLLVFYRKARRRFIRLSLGLTIAYLLIFYTPLVWLAAEPLKMSQSPKKADAIVVFAGGVGESGKAGQGFEERVNYAVSLYKQKYADNIIFSSGYTYLFKETLVMKALAVSLGISEEAIILEDKAVNTYENVKFTGEILKRNNWGRALLVSSPYHMRRVSMIFNKHIRGLEVIYTPIPESLFYCQGDEDVYDRKIWKKISPRQIKAILHEYLGIIYYKFKGYI